MSSRAAQATVSDYDGPVPVRVAASNVRLALITPVRLALGIAVLAAAVARGGRETAVTAAFAFGAVLALFAILTDRRGLLLTGGDPPPLPPDAELAAPWRAAVDAALPSTVGVAILSAIAIGAARPTLAAVLGGILAGMGAASALVLVQVLAEERSNGCRSYIEIGRQRRRYVR